MRHKRVSGPLVRILFHLEEGAWHGNTTERLWAERVSANRYRLRNTPFYAFGVSFADIVFGERAHDEVVFAGVSMRGGHHTYRLILLSEEAESEFGRFWKPLEEKGCTYEEGPVLAVDVPPQSNIHDVYEDLVAGADARVWDFEEGHCEHIVDP